MGHPAAHAVEGLVGARLRDRCIIDSTMIPRPNLSAIYGVLALLCIPAAAQNPGSAQTPLNERVLVVYNSNGAESLERGQILHGRAQDSAGEPVQDRGQFDRHRSIRVEFESRVKAPVRQCLAAVGMQKILYIVFSYQTPYVLMLRDRGFALDQFVADIWDEYAGMRPGTEVGAQPVFRGGPEPEKYLLAFHFFGRLPGPTARRECLFGVAVGRCQCRSGQTAGLLRNVRRDQRAYRQRLF